MPEIKLICFDMDDTLIEQNSWYQLNMALGVTHDEDQEMFADYRRGAISYDDWTGTLMQLYKERGLASREHIITALSDFDLVQGVHNVVNDLKEKGYVLSLITGSFDILAGLVAKELAIDYYKANATFIFDDHDMLLNIVTNRDEGFAKLRQLRELCLELGIETNECACIGDGANEIEIFLETGHGVTFTDSFIARSAWKTIDTLYDLKQIF